MKPSGAMPGITWPHRNKHYARIKIITCELTPSQEQQNQAQFHFFTSHIFTWKQQNPLLRPSRWADTTVPYLDIMAATCQWNSWFLLLWSTTMAAKMSPVKAPTGGLANIWLSHTVDTKSNMTPLQRDQLTHTHCSGNYFKKERHLAALQRCHHVTASKNWK